MLARGARERSSFFEGRHASARKKASEDVRKRAASHNVEGLEYYEKWEVEGAIQRFKEAVWLAPVHPEHHLNLARARSRFG